MNNLIIKTKKALEKATTTKNNKFFDSISNIEYFISGNLKFNGVKIDFDTKIINISLNTKTGILKGINSKEEYKIKLNEKEIDFINDFYIKKIKSNLFLIKGVDLNV